MKVCNIQIYFSCMPDEDPTYTAIMEPGSHVGYGYTPQEALTNLPEALANRILQYPNSIQKGDVELAQHFLCEPGQRFPDWVEEYKADHNRRD